MASQNKFITKLEEAAANIGSVPRRELAILLRRAAIRLRTMPPEAIPFGGASSEDSDVDGAACRPQTQKARRLG